MVAVEDGQVAKLLRNPIGGITLYLIDSDGTRIYYYAHLQAYAPGIVEGAEVRRGDVVGFVGSTGNAPERSPHLHFAIHELGGGDKRWWKGKPINPYPLLK
nr:M23/M37 family peptidase [uncultured bacterium]